MLTLLVLGIVLGLVHVLEPDHVAAVSNMVIVDQERSWRVGMSWGIGHGITIALAGGALLVVGRTIPPQLQAVMEMLVGVVVIYLALSSFSHHRGGAHVHRHRGLFVGGAHGLSGTGAMVVLMVSKVPGVWAQVGCLLLFACGNILGMTVLAWAMGLVAQHSRRWGLRWVAPLVSFLAVSLGVYMVGDNLWKLIGT